MKKLFLVLTFSTLILSCDKVTPPETNSFGDTISLEKAALSGSALYIYLDVYTRDPNKKYQDIDSSNYEKIIKQSFDYASDLSLPKPDYCNSGNYKGKGNYVYVSTVIDSTGNLKLDDFIAYANTIAPTYNYSVNNLKTKDNVGKQQNYKHK